DAEGKSALVPKSAMEMTYWIAEPIVTLFARVGLVPDDITWGSLALGAAAGIAFATGHFGLGAVIAVLGGAGDPPDRLLARRLGTASAAGEVLDAAVDRYTDFALITGVAFHFREQPLPLALSLLALLAAFMVSYSTAKADALGVVPPRGSMRRAERCVLLV